MANKKLLIEFKEVEGISNEIWESGKAVLENPDTQPHIIDIGEYEEEILNFHDGGGIELFPDGTLHIMNEKRLLHEFSPLQTRMIAGIIDKLSQKKTIKEWNGVFGYEVIDPDGFDRTDPELMQRLFTAEEYKEGALSSTIKITDRNLAYDETYGLKLIKPND